jgi:hypothetical protein
MGAELERGRRDAAYGDPQLVLEWIAEHSIDPHARELAQTVLDHPESED